MNQLIHLKTFLAVYRSGTVTRAATRLAITQPAASAHIKALEAHLRQKLFQRIGRGIEPTAAAHSLARSIAPHLDGLEDALAAATMRKASLAGALRLGGPAEFLTEKVIPALSGLPEVSIRLEVSFGVAQEIIARLDAAELDLAISTVRIPRKTIIYRPIFRETFILVGAPRWAVAAPAGVIARRGAAALAGLPWLAYASDLPLVRRYFRQVFRAEPPGEAAQVLPDLRALVQACVAGAGITVLPTYLCESQLRSGALALLHSAPEPPVNDLLLASNRLALQTPRILFVRDRLLQAAARW
jgi:DNA-binding transcriptional LysR family regulator